MIRKLTAAAIGAASALVATSALAQEPAPAPAPAAASSSSASADTSTTGASAAILIGYGTNSLDFGIGARAGYTLPMDLGPGHLGRHVRLLRRHIPE